MYEKELKKVLEKIGVYEDVWENSRELYIQNEAEVNTSVDGYSIDTVDKRVYEILPQPNIPKSLTKSKAKEILIEVNQRAHKMFLKEMRQYVADNYQSEYEPLIMEVLAFDLTFIEYSYSEVIFRFATHKFELQKDPEIKEQMDIYLSSENEM